MSNFKIQMSNQIRNPNVKKDEEEKQWNDFAIRNGGSFLQSWRWGEFQKSLGRKIWRYTAIPNTSQTDRDKSYMDHRLRSSANIHEGASGILEQALIVKYGLPFGKSYLYCPRGPVTKYDNDWRSNLPTRHIDISKFREEVQPSEIKNPIFFRIDPEIEDSEENRKALQELEFKKAPKEIQPKRTLILDITKSEEELLAQMHPKTRYNIRLAQRQGVQFSIFNFQFSNNSEISNDPNFETFWRLLQQTAKRDKFRPHPKEYYEKMLSIFSNFPAQSEARQGRQFPISNFQVSSTSKNYISGAKLFIAKYHGSTNPPQESKIIAANIVMFFGGRAAYLHGASDYNFRNLMTPYLLQWEQIKEAKKLGCAEYDFWGIDEKKWPGLTRFKKGFGGRKIEYVGAWDFVFDSFWYKIYKACHKFR